jgi:long-chain fatty acid transport protein
MQRVIKWMLTALLVATPTAASAAGFATTTQSATSTAMGGVGVANPHEPNASYYNPALMSQYEGFSISAGPTLIVPNSSYESFDGSITESTKSSVFPPPNGHASYTFDNLSIGLGATFPYGLGIEWDDGWRGRETIQYQQLQTLDITPSVAYEIPSANLTLAAGGQAVFSSIELRRSIILREDTEVQSHLGGNGNGFGALGGVLFEPTDSLTFGAQYRSAVKVNYDGRAHFEGEEGTPFENQFVDGDVTTDLTLPHSFSVGVGWQIERLFLELDFQYTTWQTYDEVVIDFERDLPQETSTITNNWRDAGAVRFGAQYEVTDDLPLRFGLGYDLTPIPDETVSASLPGNDRLIASLGAGYTTDFGLRTDLAYQLVTSIPRDIRNDVTPPGTYQTTAHIFGLNLGYGYD